MGAAVIAFGGDGRYLDALNNVAGTVSGFEIGEGGRLAKITAVGDRPINSYSSFSSGLAAR